MGRLYPEKCEACRGTGKAKNNLNLEALKDGERYWSHGKTHRVGLEEDFKVCIPCDGWGKKLLSLQTDDIVEMPQYTARACPDTACNWTGDMTECDDEDKCPRCGKKTKGQTVYCVKDV